MGWHGSPITCDHPRAVHGHPSPKMPEPTSVQAILDLFRKSDIEFQLRGLLGVDRSTVSDVYSPEVRRSPTTHRMTVTHLDLVTCWKGLSYAQAAEILFWENVFRLSLERMVWDVVTRLFAKQAREDNEAVNEQSFIPVLKHFFSANPNRSIEVAVPDLVTDMIQRFYEKGSNMLHRWFTSSHDLPTMVFNFIRTRDCFVDSWPCPSLSINFSHSQAGLGLCISGDVEWQPPHINFSCLPTRLPVGAEYRICPDFYAPILSDSFKKYPADPVFYVSSNKVHLKWDESQAAFHARLSDRLSRKASEGTQGQAPFQQADQSDKDVTTVQTTFSAKIITRFPGPSDNRFEQTTRYSIFLEVEPRSRQDIFSSASSEEIPIFYVPDPMEIVSPTASTVSIGLSSIEKNGASPKEDTAETQRTTSWLPSYTNTPASKCGRKRCNDDLSSNSPDTPSVDRSMHLQNLSRWPYQLLPSDIVSRIEEFARHRLRSVDTASPVSNSKDLNADSADDGADQGKSRLRAGRAGRKAPFGPYDLAADPTSWQSSEGMVELAERPKQDKLEALRRTWSAVDIDADHARDDVSRSYEVISPDTDNGIDCFDSLRNSFSREKRLQTKSWDWIDAETGPKSGPHEFECAGSPQKRKASKQESVRCMPRKPSSSGQSFASKRLKVDKWYHSSFNGMLNSVRNHQDDIFECDQTGVAYQNLQPSLDSSHLLPSKSNRLADTDEISFLPSRAYEAVDGSMILPAVKKGGSLRKTIVPNKKPLRDDTARSTTTSKRNPSIDVVSSARFHPNTPHTNMFELEGTPVETSQNTNEATASVPRGSKRARHDSPMSPISDESKNAEHVEKWDPDTVQHMYRENWEQFIKEKQAKEEAARAGTLLDGADDVERKEMEKVFLEGSDDATGSELAVESEEDEEVGRWDGAIELSKVMQRVM